MPEIATPSEGRESRLNKNKKFLYKTPQGAEGLFLDDAFRRQRMIQDIQGLFTGWGYHPVQTPVFDFYDVYSPHLSAAMSEKVYRLVDREGDLLMLRPDITLFLARALSLTLREGHEPLRVFYCDTILRHQDLEDISANEFFQIGAEFVGSRGPEGDLEILLLLEDILNCLRLPEARIHLGSRSLVKALFPAMDPAQEIQILSAISTRTLKSENLIQELFGFIGTRSEFVPLWEKCRAALPPEALDAIGALIETLKILEELDPRQRFRLDFSEVGRQPYYTGLVFSAYTANVADAVASGGRYDDLLQNFGLNTPSVGFSFHLKKIEHLTDDPARFRLPEPEKASGKTFAERFQKARELRSQGRVAIL